MSSSGTTLIRPVLSVIIVTYKSRQEIDDCLESIPIHVRQGPVEVIVVDNNSGDGLVEHMRRPLPGSHLAGAAGELGFGKANNLGYARCTGDYVLFLNPTPFPAGRY